MSTRELFPGVSSPADAIRVVAELLNAYGIAAAGDHHAAAMNLRHEGLTPPLHAQVNAYCRASIMAIVTALVTRESVPAVDGNALPWCPDAEFGQGDDYQSLEAGHMHLAVTRYGERWEWSVSMGGDDWDGGMVDSEQGAKRTAVSAARGLLDEARAAVDGEGAHP